jgi:hypothetical protein
MKSIIALTASESQVSLRTGECLRKLRHVRGAENIDKLGCSSLVVLALGQVCLFIVTEMRVFEAFSAPGLSCNALWSDLSFVFPSEGLAAVTAAGKSLCARRDFKLFIEARERKLCA